MADHQDHTHSRQEQIFEHLVSSNQWERVIELAPTLLAEEADNSFVHRSVAIAFLQVEDLPKAKHHLDRLLQLEPESPGSHFLSGLYHEQRNRPLLAKQSFEEALRIDPEIGEIWMAYAWNCHGRGDSKSAMEAALNARMYLPESIDLERLETAIEGELDGPQRISAWEQIEAMEKALRLNPEDSATMHHIGHLYLNQLGRSAEAEMWLRKAIQIAPTDDEIQKTLLQAVRRRDPVLRFLHWPYHLFLFTREKAESLSARNPWLLLLLSPLLFAIALLLMVLLSFWLIFLYLPGKLYEYLTLSEAIANASQGRYAARTGIYRLPWWLRFSLFLFAGIGFAVAIGWFFTSPAAAKYHDAIIGGLMILAMAFGIWFSAKHKN